MTVHESPDKLPGTFKEFCRRFPELGKLHQETGEALARVGPLDRKTSELVKIGLCVGADEQEFRRRAEAIDTVSWPLSTSA